MIETPLGDDDRIHLLPGDKIEFNISSGVDLVQWRSNHLEMIGQILTHLMRVIQSSS